ncbi:MAG: hypothetical protein JJLCMIEE_01289 [Acidimicrobiales bacterium]|nr:MAG: hypothetical protein EDR02_06970 [Actinomycetota bacterium]MBV6508229.1 hypothetical protein [Acidimicrobiales bacterium]RIK07303.1 MAG: hypothetical protein DCC48_04280 [Acidobacteriota bacterium]
MTTDRPTQEAQPVSDFEVQRPELTALAYDIAFRLLGDQTSAIEVAKESLLRIEERWQKVSNRPIPWAAAMSLHLALDRRQQPLYATSVTGDAHATERAELATRLESMSVADRTIIALRHLSDFSIPEVAELLGRDLDDVAAVADPWNTVSAEDYSHLDDPDPPTLGELGIGAVSHDNGNRPALPGTVHAAPPPPTLRPHPPSAAARTDNGGPPGDPVTPPVEHRVSTSPADPSEDSPRTPARLALLVTTIVLVVIALLAIMFAVRGGDDSETTTAVEPAGTEVQAETEAADPAASEGESGSEESSAPLVTRSSGCGTNSGLVLGEAQARELSAGSLDRSYQVFVPSSYDPDTPLPAVINLHAYSSPANVQSNLSEMDQYAEENGFITIAPQGLGEIPSWNVTEEPAGADDVAFISAVLDEVEAFACVNPAMVYVTGLENGAQMASLLACRLSDRVAAVAVVAGAWMPPGCETGSPVPYLAFHGTDDEWITIEGEYGAGDPYGSYTEDYTLTRENIDLQPMDEAVQLWALRNGCRDEMTDEQVTDNVSLLTYSAGCDDEAVAMLYVVGAAGHTWPGSDEQERIEELVGPTSYEISANELIWQFFIQHQRGR